MNINDERLKIQQEITKLEKELERLNGIKNAHLDFGKLNEISRYAFGSIGIDFRKIVTSIHLLQVWGEDICGNKHFEFARYGETKMRELTKEQIQESNELLQKMLEPYVEKIKEKINKLKGEQNG